MRNAYSIRPKGRVTTPTGPGLTEQRHMKECDIHNILGKQKRGQMITHLAKHAGTYGDYTNAPDFMTAQLIVTNAMTMFESIPADIRARFGNDPAAFLDFIQEEGNREEIEALGFGTEHLGEDSRPIFDERQAEAIRALAQQTADGTDTSVPLDQRIDHHLVEKAAYYPPERVQRKTRPPQDPQTTPEAS